MTPPPTPTRTQTLPPVPTHQQANSLHATLHQLNLTQPQNPTPVPNDPVKTLPRSPNSRAYVEKTIASSSVTITPTKPNKLVTSAPPPSASEPRPTSSTPPAPSRYTTVRDKIQSQPHLRQRAYEILCEHPDFCDPPDDSFEAFAASTDPLLADEDFAPDDDEDTHIFDQLPN